MPPRYVTIVWQDWVTQMMKLGVTSSCCTLLALRWWVLTWPSYVLVVPMMMVHCTNYRVRQVHVWICWIYVM